MLFEPPIDLLVKQTGCRYAAAIIVSARAKELMSKIAASLNGNSNLAIDYAAEEVARGEVVGTKS